MNLNFAGQARRMLPANGVGVAGAALQFVLARQTHPALSVADGTKIAEIAGALEATGFVAAQPSLAGVGCALVEVHLTGLPREAEGTITDEAIGLPVLQVKTIDAQIQHTLCGVGQLSLPCVGDGAMPTCHDAIQVALCVGADDGHIKTADGCGAVTVGRALAQRVITGGHTRCHRQCCVRIQITALAPVLAHVICTCQHLLTPFTSKARGTGTVVAIDAVNAGPAVLA